MPKEEFTPKENSVNEEDVTSAEPTVAKKKGLGTGAIVGIAVAGAVVLAGVGVGGAAIGASVAHNDRGGFSRQMDGQFNGQMPGGDRDHDRMGQMKDRGVDPDGDNWTGQNKQGPMGQNGQMPGQDQQQQPQSGSTATPNAAPAPQGGNQSGPLNGFTRGS